MRDGAREEDDAGSRPADEAALSARLRRLGDQLRRVGASSSPEAGHKQSPTDTSALAAGFRLASEFVAGILAGALLGWGLDRLLGISPWGLIVFLLLGFAASVLNLMRGSASASSHRHSGIERREK
jgi:ATP synthase protein I